MASLVASRWRVLAVRLRHPQVRLQGRVLLEAGCRVTAGAGSVVVVEDCVLARGVTLATAPGAELVVRADYVGPGAMIVARSRVVIGPGTKIAEHVTIRDANHDRRVPLREKAFVSAPVEIGADVWVGCKATILSGVVIGDGATIAAGAVVTRDVAPGQTVAGVPALPLPRPERR